MATVLAAQLAQLAAKSTNQLDLKAQKKAHSKSLLFDQTKASGQDFDSLYELCRGGFEDLCEKDRQFLKFNRSIFAEESKSQDRSQLTSAENEKLDGVLGDFLSLVGSRLLLRPAQHAVEWLVRRFRVHEYNTETLLFTFLPYHSLPMFATLLSILPAKLPPVFRWLHPYVESIASPPRQALVNTAIRDTSFITTWSTYVLQVHKRGYQYQALTSYWATITCDAVIGQLDQNIAGRKEARRQKEEDILLRLLPILNDGMNLRKASDMRTGCYMILAILAANMDLQDKVLSAMMEAVVGRKNVEVRRNEMICLSILTQKLQLVALPKRVFKALMALGSLQDDLAALNNDYDIGCLCLGLVKGVLGQLKSQDDLTNLGLIAKSAEQKLLVDSQLSAAVIAILHTADDANTNLSTTARSLLGDLVVRLAESEVTSETVRKTIEQSGMNVQQIESKLQNVLLPGTDQALLTFDTDMDDVGAVVEGDTYESLKAKIPTRTAYETSFLSHAQSYIFDSLFQAFARASRNTEDLRDFSDLPVLRRPLASTEPLFLTFFVRVCCGSSRSHTRAAALTSIRELVQSKDLSADPQVLLPYVLYALADPSVQVRRAASNLTISLKEFYEEKEISATKLSILGADDIYGDEQKDKQLSWLSTKELGSILDNVLVPNLEECCLDAAHISQVLGHALNGDSEVKSHKSSKKELKSSTRSSLLAFLSSHVIQTSLLSVKYRVLKELFDVGKAGGSSKSKSFSQLVLDFEGMDEKKLREKCDHASITTQDICSQVVGTVSTSDRDGIKVLHRIILSHETSPPLALRIAAIGHLRHLWKSMKTDSQLASMNTLLSLANSSDSLSGEALDAVRQMPLSTDVTKALLSELPSLSPDLREGPAVTKRRRTSHGHVDGQPHELTKASLQKTLRNATIILELVESSPENHSPELSGPLFRVLADMHNVKNKLGVDFSYAQAVIFSCLYASIEAARKTKATLDSHAIRADLVVDCFRTTTSTQVQQASLLLMSSLAAITPDLIVHSVMPIFTFMGSNMLRQADDYSAHVIERTIESVIPPLIESFRKDNRGPLAGASELLLSFVAAFDHIPMHRRLDLFSALIERLGPQDFLFALLVLLVDRYENAEAPMMFATELCHNYSPGIQLRAIDQYLEVVLDTLKAKPTAVSQYLISKDNGHNKVATAFTLLQLLTQLLLNTSLISTINKVVATDDGRADDIRSTYAHLVEQTLTLSGQAVQFKKLQAPCSSFLDALLGVLSLEESIRSLEHLLEDGYENIKRQVLRSLDKRISTIRTGSQISRQACLKFLPRLQTLLEASSDVALRQTALACMDRIAEKFGKASLDEMEGLAGDVSGTKGLGCPEPELRIMSLICLTTLIEVLGDAIVPVIPRAVPLALSHLKATVEADEVDEGLYNAAFGFFGALFLYVPWMMTGEYLHQFINVSEASAGDDLSAQCDQSRTNSLELLAKQVSPQDCFAALRNTWSQTVEQGTSAVDEHLMMLSLAIERHSKSVIVKNSSTLGSLSLDVLGLRCQVMLEKNEEYDDEDMSDVENSIGEIMIKMIYKLNDTHFRPMFIKMLEWANDSSSKKAKQGRVLRQVSLYKFLHTFFETLKSIVTSYSGLILENAVESLKNSSPVDSTTSLLWYRILSTLQSAFEHDQDDFWQSPSRFEPASDMLLDQFESCSTEEPASALIRCLTSFASAADSAENMKVINAGIMKHMRAESSGVRLAAVRCEISITEALGEEWLSLLPEILPFISEAMEDDDEEVGMEVRRWVRNIEAILGESLDSMLQ